MESRPPTPRGNGMQDDPDISDLIHRARDGDNLAIREFLDRFEGEVRIMVRGQLPRKLRNQFDSMDFVQSVWQSFFSILQTTSREFANTNHLRAFLAGVARNKVYEVHRKLTRTQKYALSREEPRGGRDWAGGDEFELISPEPTPSQEVQASDRLAQLIAGCSTRQVQVITLRHQGMTFEEIARRTGINERSVRRVIDEARERMEARGWQ